MKNEYDKILEEIKKDEQSRKISIMVAKIILFIIIFGSVINIAWGILFEKSVALWIIGLLIGLTGLFIFKNNEVI